MAMAAVVFMFVLMGFLPPCPAAEQAKVALSYEEQLRLGERIYREGILPSGEAVQAVVKSDITVSGTSFTCVSCHLRSGLGSSEGGVVTPPTTGAKLFQPYQNLYKGIAHDPKYFPIPPRRPAYTDASLAEVLRAGIDPAGRVLNDVMPRYLLENQDMELLITYLKSLSAVVSPGVTDTSLRFATVITDEVSLEDRTAMLDPLQNYVNIKNGQVRFFKTQLGSRSLLMAENMMPSRELALRTLSLDVWLLKGPPETWRNQLEAYNRKQPVFALIGGITTGEWRPIHQFSEDNHIPCLFPDTEFPVISQSDWYTLYLSKGYYQEGEGAARYLNRRNESLQGKGLVQIVRDTREGRALAAGFLDTWRELGHEPPRTITLKPGDDTGTAVRQQVLKQGKTAALILWDGAAAVPALEAVAANTNRPDVVLVSSSYIGKSIWTLTDTARDLTSLTYPYRLPQAAQDKLEPTFPKMANKVFPADTSVIANQTYSVIQVLSMVLMALDGNYYRDNFMDVTGMIMDQEVPLYERLSFGPGQRYASKGCYIVQLAHGAKQELIKKSGWVIQ